MCLMLRYKMLKISHVRTHTHKIYLFYTISQLPTQLFLIINTYFYILQLYRTVDTITKWLNNKMDCKYKEKITADFSCKSYQFYGFSCNIKLIRHVTLIGISEASEIGNLCCKCQGRLTLNICCILKAHGFLTSSNLKPKVNKSC